MFPPRHNFMPPRPGMMHQERPRFPPLNFPPPLGQAPPVTVLVPYPVVLPIPLPIPVPIPLSSFLRAHCANRVKTEVNNDDTEGPLDFTMNGNKNRNEEPGNSEQCETSEPSNVIETQNDTNDRVEEERHDTEVPETSNPEQTLPKFKITRLGNKMAKIVAKVKEPSESTRPLRKRRRLVEVSTDEDPLIPKTRKIVQV